MLQNEDNDNLTLLYGTKQNGNLFRLPFLYTLKINYAFRLIQFKSSNATSKRLLKLSSALRNQTRGS